MKSDIITNLPFYDFLLQNEKESILNNSQIKFYKKKQFIYDYTDECLGMIYVIKGSIRVYMLSEEGREITLFHIADNDCCILSASCVLKGLSLEVHLIAEKDTEVLAINAICLKKIIDHNLQVRSFSYELSTKKLSKIVWVMNQILFTHFDKRLAHFLISIYNKTNDNRIKLTQEKIAQEVNSSREVVARMLKEFALEGWIENSRGVIILKDIESLKKILK